METVAFCESDKKCQLVLKKHWPDVPIYEDIRELNGKQFKGQTIDLICGGPPCQPASQAGKQRGERDDRWLWPETFRVISEFRPKWCILENVSGLLALDNGMAFERLCVALEEKGYEIQTLIIPACAVNAPHRRDRVWIIAHANKNQQPNGAINGDAGCGELGEDLAHSQSGESGFKETRNRGEGVSGRGQVVANTTTFPRNLRSELGGNGRENETKQAGVGGQDAPNSNQAGLQKRERQDPSRKGSDSGPIFKRSERWSIESGVGGLVDGISSGLDGHWDIEPPDIPRVAVRVKGRVHQLKQLGNAVVPQVVEIIGRAIMEVERG